MNSTDPARNRIATSILYEHAKNANGQVDVITLQILCLLALVSVMSLSGQAQDAVNETPADPPRPSSQRESLKRPTKPPK